MLVTYKKRNGEVINRIINSYKIHRVGDINSYGWEVIDVKYKYKNKYYNYNEWSKLIDEALEKDNKKRKFKNNFKNFIKSVNQLVNLLVILRVFILISNKAVLELFISI